MMIVGRASGRIRPGRVLDRPGGPAEGVYLSMMDTMAVVRQANWRRTAGESPAEGRNNQPRL